MIFHGMYIHILFIHWTVGRHLGWFHFFAIVNNIAVNVDIQIILQNLIFSLSECIARFFFEKPLYGFQQQLHHFTFSSIMHKGSNLSTSLARLFSIFNSHHPSGCGVIAHGFDLHFHYWLCWASFHMFIGHLYIFWRNVYSSS